MPPVHVCVAPALRRADTTISIVTNNSRTSSGRNFSTILLWLIVFMILNCGWNGAESRAK